RSYEGYRVEGSAEAVPVQVAAAGEAPGRLCRPRGFGSITVSSEARSESEKWQASWDSAAAKLAQGDTATGKERCARAFIVTRADSTDLVSGPAFDASIYDEGEGPLSATEMESLADLVRDLPGVPWGVSRPTLQFLTPDLVRFNRVEGLSLAARATLPLGPASIRGEARVGTTGEFGARLAGVRSTPSLRAELAGYRGLEAVQVTSQPFSLASSASALFLGRDENDYFRGTGAEIRLAPAEARRQRWDARVFAERQERVRARSDLSVRGLFDSSFDARPNVAADRADQLGATLRFRAARGDDPAGLRTRAELELHGETGDFSFARPVVRLGADGGIGGGIGFGLALTAGSGFGEIPAQRAWQIGGATSVRGHDPATLRGESVWLARGELTRGTPLLRLAVFGDAGWTGDADDLWSARPLRGAGVGVSILDNLLRVDVARGIGGGGYRVHLRMGGSL
ncbi:MAG TPA: ShlB/FhaC/HecB family hemolysin secretion/activation protein, partial [Longimicrobium sp.]